MMTTRSGSSKSASTARSRGRWPPNCIRISPRPMTQRRTAPRSRLSAGSRSTRPTRVGAARRPGRSSGERDRGGDGAAPHLPGRGSAPASAPADQRPRARRRHLARAAHGRGAGLDRGDQRHRARRGDDRPTVPGSTGRARLHPRPRHRRDRAARQIRGRRSVPGPRRSDATSTATKPSGAPPTRAASPARRCGGRGTRGRGPTPGRTRSCRATGRS